MFAKDEAGGGLAMGLFMFVTMVMLLALGLDFSNSWRNRTYLMSSADMAAHAGAVALAKGGTPAQVRAAVADNVEHNMPHNFFGNVITTSTDVHMAFYDRSNRTFTTISSGNPNAVVVELYRTKGRNNAVMNTLMPFLGIESFDVDAISAAVFDQLGDCNHSDGIYANGIVTLTSQTDVGGGFCIHSEEAVWLPQQNIFAVGAMVTMTDLAECKNKCNESANPGIVAGEAHMNLGDIGARIMTTYNSFMGAMGTGGIKDNFFLDDVTDPLDPVISLGNTAALEAMLGIAPPVLGQVITMTESQVESLPDLPSGLVYYVPCTANGNGPNTRLTFSGSAAKMIGSALLTNCSIEFDAGSSIRSSVVITTRDSTTAAVNAHNNVTMGDPTLSCIDTDRTFIMSMSKVTVPAEFVMSNVTMLVDDDVNIASATSSNPTSYGFAIYASGEVSFAAQHTFRVCGSGYTGGMTPEAKILRLVEPPLPLL